MSRYRLMISSYHGRGIQVDTSTLWNIDISTFFNDSSKISRFAYMFSYTTSIRGCYDLKILINLNNFPFKNVIFKIGFTAHCSRFCKLSGDNCQNVFYISLPFLTFAPVIFLTIVTSCGTIFRI